jgi:hypothetical protein
MERGAKSRRLHFHLLVDVGADIRTGFDFEQVDKGNYCSAGSEIRAVWGWLRKMAPAYGFGRTELLPLKKPGEAVGHYVGKYIAKHVVWRDEADKGARLVRYSGPCCFHSTRFAWSAGQAALWRRCLAQVASWHGFTDLGEFAERYGPRWAYHLRPLILRMGAEDPPGEQGGQLGGKPGLERKQVVHADGRHGLSGLRTRGTQSELAMRRLKIRNKLRVAVARLKAQS